MTNQDTCVEYFEDEDVKSCGCADDERCPLCCPVGLYHPGTEECDFCQYSDECEKDLEAWFEHENQMRKASK